ncbi:hypothetical protein [Pseudomonas nunensis]|uniref:Uncharacterized protein n=1 Tax=Pseudomonas nunensis TaxID=2961896 RepID=A0ABY5EHC6_9PSED|nr:hypothetical protein [Pseudomonas nunensis]MCL5224573.1 hypothetical protein [Pseudomonas nunensis]UTO14187.1 hypothetical protein NK667_29210 [Pseudomonas nunensis]
MNTYIVLHRGSNLVINVTNQTEKPSDTVTHRFIPASDKSLKHLLLMSRRQNSTLVDIGDLMLRSGYIADQVSNGKVGKSKPVTTRHVNERESTMPTDRESTIRHWVENNPDANHHDLSEVFFTGTLVAKAYLSRYR